MLTPNQHLTIAQAKLASVKILLKQINHYANLASKNAFPEDADKQTNYIGGCLLKIEETAKNLSDLVQIVRN